MRLKLEKDAYKKIQEKMHSYPLGAPEDDAFTEILKVYFTPREAEVVAELELHPKSVSDIAKEVDQPESELALLLEDLANRGLVFSRKKEEKILYMLLPPIPGLFEFPFMIGEKIPNFEELRRLWNEYYRKTLGPYMHDERGPATMRVITLDRQLSRNLEIMPFDSASKIVSDARLLGLARCPCRQATRKCQAPLDVCILLNNFAEFLIDRHIARKISLDEAQNALIRAEAAGLVHTTNNSIESLPFVCNCCSCCCFMLRGVTELNLPKAVAASRYQAQLNKNNCDACGLCLLKCHFRAINLSATAEITPEKCYGCGLCVAECPNQALSLVPRLDYIPPPPTGAELLKQLALARGKV